MKNLTFSIILIGFVLSLTPETGFPQTQFQLAIGAIGNGEAYSIIQTTDGGYAAVGYSFDAFGGRLINMYIVKLGVIGTIEWTKSVGGFNEDAGYSIIQTADGGYAVAGFTTSFGAGGYEMYIVKLNSSGALQWSKTIGSTITDVGYSIIQTPDGGYAVAGYTNSFGAGGYDMYIVKLDGNGTIQWNKTIGGTNDDYALSIIRTSDGGYAVSGYTFSFGAGGSDMYIVKLDVNGTIQWNRTVGGTDLDYSYYSIIQTTDGGYAVAGYTQSFGPQNAYIVKLDGSGTLQWGRSVGGTNYDAAFSIIQTSDYGYAAVGYTGSFGAGNNDIYIIKLDVSGALQWTKTVGGSNQEGASSIIRTADGGYAIAGFTGSFGAGNYDYYFVKLEANWITCGNSSSPSSTSGSGGSTTSPTPTVTSPAPTVTTPLSLTASGGTVTSICLVGVTNQQGEIPSSFHLYQNYPNPFNPATKINFDVPSNLTLSGAKGLTVQLKIFDLLGREVATLVNEQLQPGSYEVDWDASNYPSGVYIYKLTAGDFTNSKKMLMIK